MSAETSDSENVPLTNRVCSSVRCWLSFGVNVDGIGQWYASRGPDPSMKGIWRSAYSGPSPVAICACGHDAQLPDEWVKLAAGYGADLEKARARLRCVQCGGRMPRVEVYRVGG
jgi:hypothetical protein